MARSSHLAKLPLLWSSFVCLVGCRKSFFQKPTIMETSGHCASVQFAYDAPSKDTEGPGDVYIFALPPTELEFLLWGKPSSATYVKPQYGQATNLYRVLVRDLPKNSSFRVMLSSNDEIGEKFGGAIASEPSDFGMTNAEPTYPLAPTDLEVHRTDPRQNPVMHDGSVCLDLHWSHPHSRLAGLPSDVFFRISYSYEGEPPRLICEESPTSTLRTCGQELRHVGSGKILARYVTVCSLRPKRRIRFDVEAVNCDGDATIQSLFAHSPPTAPSVVGTLVTDPAEEESIAGFRPRVVLDWIPQHDDLILGHAIYLGLVEVSAMKLLCWVPRKGSGTYGAGHIEMPILHKNNIFSSHANLLEAYLWKNHVHQEQEVLVTTRINGSLESPAFRLRLGEYLVMDDSLKCLNSFQAERPMYPTSPSYLSWTQEQAFSVFG